MFSKFSHIFYTLTRFLDSLFQLNIFWQQHGFDVKPRFWLLISSICCQTLEHTVLLSNDDIQYLMLTRDLWDLDSIWSLVLVKVAKKEIQTWFNTPQFRSALKWFKKNFRGSSKIAKAKTLAFSATIYHILSRFWLVFSRLLVSHIIWFEYVRCICICLIN